LRMVSFMDRLVNEWKSLPKADILKAE
jgi:hypothetical protein